MSAQDLLPNGSEDSSDDDVLIQSCLLGSAKAWSSLIRKYANLIFSIPINRGLSREEAADVFQSVCVALLGSLANLRDPRALAAYIIQTTAHTCDRLQHLRQRWVGLDREFTRTMLSHDLPDQLVRRLETEQLLREAVQHQNPECRKLIELLFFNDPPIPYEEAAGRLGLARGSIGATRMRCLEKVRRYLEEKGFR